MMYDFDGKKIKIADEDIERTMSTFGISKEEAIQVWLEDEGYLDNEEQNFLEQKAKANNITATIHDAAKGKPRKERKVVKKENPLKKEVISLIFEALSVNFDDVSIKNDEKYIDFVVDGREFTINLVEHRAKKEKKS